MKNIFIARIAYEIRRIRGISLKNAAYALGICHRTLSRAERGEAPFLAGYLLPLAKCYGIAPADFFWFNPSTKRFERPVPVDYLPLKQEVEALRVQVRQLSDFIHFLQNERAGGESLGISASSKLNFPKALNFQEMDSQIE
ncbi:MAG: helix-turn-helix domain-containing protein [Saprospiraceae bacterium]